MNNGSNTANIVAVHVDKTGRVHFGIHADGEWVVRPATGHKRLFPCVGYAVRHAAALFPGKRIFVNGFSAVKVCEDARRNAPVGCFPDEDSLKGLIRHVRESASKGKKVRFHTLLR